MKDSITFLLTSNSRFAFTKTLCSKEFLRQGEIGSVLITMTITMPREIERTGNEICTGNEDRINAYFSKKKFKKNIGHRVSFRDMFEKLTFEGYVLGGFWLPWQQILRHKLSRRKP